MKWDCSRYGYPRENLRKLFAMESMGWGLPLGSGDLERVKGALAVRSPFFGPIPFCF